MVGQRLVLVSVRGMSGAPRVGRVCLLTLTRTLPIWQVVTRKIWHTARVTPSAASRVPFWWLACKTVWHAEAGAVALYELASIKLKRDRPSWLKAQHDQANLGRDALDVHGISEAQDHRPDVAYMGQERHRVATPAALMDRWARTTSDVGAAPLSGRDERGRC